MAKGLNCVHIIGNVGADVETRYTAAGQAISSVRIATSEQWKDKDTGEKQERTEWHRVKFFGRLAEIVAEYVTKGRQIYVQGSIRSSEYTDKDGVKRWAYDIVADEMQLLGGNPNAQQGSGPATQQGQGQRPPAGQRNPNPPQNDPNFDDSDIPF